MAPSLQVSWRSRLAACSLALVAAAGLLRAAIVEPRERTRAPHVELIDVYARDYLALRAHSRTYPPKDALRGMTKPGAVPAAGPAGWSRPTEGSRWIVQQARRPDPRPLYVLVWGAITDVAQAVHDAPGIMQCLRVYFVASRNERQDPAAFRYLDTHHRDR